MEMQAKCGIIENQFRSNVFCHFWPFNGQLFFFFFFFFIKVVIFLKFFFFFEKIPIFNLKKIPNPPKKMS